MVKKATKGPTAKKIKDLTEYASEVALFSLSKGIKKGAVTYKNVVLVRSKRTSGKNNTSIWLASENGEILFVEPVKELSSKDAADAFEQIGYKLG